MAERRISTWRKLLAGALVACSLLAVAHLGRATLPGLRGDDVVTGQLAWLTRAAPGAAAEMQALFPEGEFFTWALTGLAAGNLAREGVDVEHNLSVVETALAETGKPHVAARFGTHQALPHGAFYHGWRLLLLADRAALSGQATHLAEATAEAEAIMAALVEDPLPDSYPGQAWPCDLVVALAAVHRVDGLRPLPGLAALTDEWFARMEPYRDPATGLFVHQQGESSARGSSQAIIQTFLPGIDAERAAAEWARFKQHFVVSTLGLVGVREHAIGSSGGGDIDSGPLVDGVSASASAVTLAAARRNGDSELATVLDREADLLGMPLPAFPGTAFAFGALPVGDAFVAWSRAVPAAPGSGEPSPQPWWPVMWLLALLPAACGLALLSRARRRQ